MDGRRGRKGERKTKRRGSLEVGRYRKGGEGALHGRGRRRERKPKERELEKEGGVGREGIEKGKACG